MFSKILIANRGEIALRIVRACRELGLKTVAAYSEPDRNALHTVLADEKICIGPARASESYLNMPNLLSAAEVTKADAIHPGYGFLAENARFAEICESSGIAFIGPSAPLIKLMGNKSLARQEMKRAHLPIIPGSDEIVQDLVQARKIAKKVGFPVIIKAAAGGGGKGMRIARSLVQLEEQFGLAQTEAQAAFNDSSLYIERYLPSARHIEIQVIGDRHGHVTALGERECSIQRKHQKIIEETPSPAVDERLRRKLVKAAADAAEHIKYDSLGTFEFLLDEQGRYYFMEANTRIQVEHPITEMVYGVDLVQEQIRIAAGDNLTIHDDMKMRGHSIECRINAEDPVTYSPSPGTIDFLVFPGGHNVRVDSAAYQGWKIPPDYDSLVAKVAVQASSRPEALKKMQAALEMTTVVGIKTNLPLHLQILADTDFIQGKYDTQFMERFQQRVNGQPK